VFTTTIANVTSATEGEGARIYKWPADPKHVQQNNGNDFAWFRLAEIYLIKAEAELAGGRAPRHPGAVAAGAGSRVPRWDTLSAVTTDVILRERLFELNSEGKRRQDLIRHGKYTQPGNSSGTDGGQPRVDADSQTQIDANALITQNPGY